MQIRAQYAHFLIKLRTKILFIYKRITVVSFKILLQSEVKCIFGVLMQSTTITLLLRVTPNHGVTISYLLPLTIMAAGKYKQTQFNHLNTCFGTYI